MLSRVKSGEVTFFRVSAMNSVSKSPLSDVITFPPHKTGEIADL